jgi:hypothetical protein
MYSSCITLTCSAGSSRSAARRSAVEARALRLGLGFIRQPRDLQGAVNRLTADADLAGRFAYAASGSAATCYVSIVGRYSLPVMLLPARV